MRCRVTGPMRRAWIALLLAWLLPAAAAQAQDWRISPKESARLAQALDGPAGARLKPADRRILQATLALHGGDYARVATLLADKTLDADPLANVLRAEAHRRLALDALQRAGHYARHAAPLESDLSRLDLTPDLAEADARLRAFAEELDRALGEPVDVLALGHDVASVVLVDKDRARLFVFVPDGKGGLKLADSEYASTGARPGDKRRRGDMRTPDGVYRFVAVRAEPRLAPRYGPLVFPIDYPNDLDRLHGKDGDGIWLHGYAENVCRRPPRDTNGCVALPNDRLLVMRRYIKPRASWMIVGESLRFNDAAARQALADSVRAAIQSWLRDWQSLDTEAYLSHYHPAFRSGRYNLARWKRYKRRVNARKRYIRVSIDDLTILHDPNRWPEGEVVVAEFRQSYDSDNYRDVTRKRLYLARGGAGEPWRILIETSEPAR